MWELQGRHIEFAMRWGNVGKTQRLITSADGEAFTGSLSLETFWIVCVQLFSRAYSMMRDDVLPCFKCLQDLE